MNGENLAAGVEEQLSSRLENWRNTSNAAAMHRALINGTPVAVRLQSNLLGATIQPVFVRCDKAVTRVTR